MSRRILNIPVAAVLAAGAAAVSSTASDPASATPLAGAFALGATATTGLLPVWWYREWGSGYAPPPYYRDYRSYPRYYRSDYDGDYDAPPRTYRYGYDYEYAYDRYPAYRYPRYGSGAAAYCASRYLSWDPDTGTFIGYDGLRHPCP